MKIVAFLQDLPLEPKVVIAEACGIGDVRVPVDFGWSGRIAAFSGRSGVCGWARHAMLYNNPLRQLGFKAVSVEERSSTYLKYYLDLFSHLSAGDTAQAKIDILALKAYGVTHVIFGRYEKGLFPTYSLENIPTDLPLKAVFKSLNGMGVLKIDE